LVQIQPPLPNSEKAGNRRAPAFRLCKIDRQARLPHPFFGLLLGEIAAAARCLRHGGLTPANLPDQLRPAFALQRFISGILCPRSTAVSFYGDTYFVFGELKITTVSNCSHPAVQS